MFWASDHFFTHLVTHIYHFFRSYWAFVDLTLSMDNLYFGWRVLVCILALGLFCMHELALYDVMVHRRACSLGSISMSVAAVFGDGLALGGVLDGMCGGPYLPLSGLGSKSSVAVFIAVVLAVAGILLCIV